MTLVRLPGTSRRRFIVTGSTVLASIGAFSTAKAAEFQFRCATNQVSDAPLNVRMRQMWAAIERESGGRIQTKLFPNSILGSDDASFAQLRLGALDFFAMTSGNLSSLIPAADISFVPFVFKDADEAMRAHDGELGGYIRDLAAAQNLHIFRYVWDAGTLQITSSLRPIRTPDDIRGFKVRVTFSKIITDALRELGSNPVTITFSEVYTALQTKLVDGATGPISSIELARYYEVQKYLSLTNISWTGPWLVANGDVWKRLPPNLQAVVERNTMKYALQERRDIKVLNVSLIDKLGRQGMVVNTVDPAPFRARLGPYFQRWAATFGPAEWGLLEKSIGRKLG